MVHRFQDSHQSLHGVDLTEVGARWLEPSVFGERRAWTRPSRIWRSREHGSVLRLLTSLEADS